MKLNRKLLIGFGFAALAITSCGNDDDSSTPTLTETVTVNQVSANYAAIARANYGDALTDAQALQTAVIAFTEAPSAELFQAAKDAWLTARESYGTTEAFRLSDGPIDGDGSNGEEGPEGLLNSWPMDENFVQILQIS